MAASIWRSGSTHCARYCGPAQKVCVPTSGPIGTAQVHAARDARPLARRTIQPRRRVSDRSRALPQRAVWRRSLYLVFEPPDTKWQPLYGGAGVRIALGIADPHRKYAFQLAVRSEPRKYTPHVTLARLRAAPYSRVGEYLTDHALYRSAPFGVDHFILFSSRLTPNGSLYMAEREYALR